MEFMAISEIVSRAKDNLKPEKRSLWLEIRQVENTAAVEDLEATEGLLWRFKVEPCQSTKFKHSTNTVFMSK